MTSTDRPTELLLRPAGPADAAAVAELHLDARRAAVPLMPALVRPEQEVRAWLRDRVVEPAADEETWVAEAGSAPPGGVALVGYARLTGEWLDDLYVAPARQGRGVGAALLALVQALRPGGLGLWVFASNLPAREFYRRHGFSEVERTDGSDNEEKAPDIRMVWAGSGRTG